MSVIAYTIVKPRAGKRTLVEDRVRRAGAIYAKHGSQVKLSRVIAGPYTDCLTFQRKYESFSAAATTLGALASDDEFAQLQSEREEDPAVDILVGREILRVVHGSSAWDTHPVSHLRVYEVNKNHLADALALLPEVEQMVAPSGVNVIGLVPVTGDNMSTMTIAYQLKSVDHWGEVMDTIGTSPEFLAITARAAEYGTIKMSSAMVPF